MKHVHRSCKPECTAIWGQAIYFCRNHCYGVAVPAGQAIDHPTTPSGAFTTFPRKRLTVSNYQKSTITGEIRTMREKSPSHCLPGDR